MSSISHGHHHDICVLHLLVSTSRWSATILINHNRQSTCGKLLLRIIHRNTRWSSQIRTQFVTSQDYQTRQLFTEEGSLSIPNRTGHNQHTHRQHSPTRAQLKGSSCPSAIPSSTWGMPFWAQLEQCHVLDPYPELDSRLQQQNCLAGDTYRWAQPLPDRQARSASKPPTIENTA